MLDKRFEKARLHHQRGELEEAFSLYEELLQEDPKQEEVLHAMALVLTAKKQYQAALVLTQQAIRLSSRQAIYFNTLGLLELRLKHLSQSEKAFQQAIKIDTNYAIAYNNLGNCYLAQKKNREAQSAYQKAFALNPHYVDPAFNLGLWHMRHDDYTQAKIYFESVLQQNAKHASTHGHLGQIYLLEKNLDKAIFHFEKRLEQEPDHSNTLQDLGLAFLEKKAYVAAEKTLLKALGLPGSPIDLHHHLGITYLYLQQYETALTHFLQQLSIHPYYESYFNIGVLLMYEERLKEAADYLNQALKLQPESLEASLNLGVVMLKAKNIPEAIHHYQKALALDPSNEEITHILNALSQNKETYPKAPATYIQHLFDQYAPYYDFHLQERLDYQVPLAIKTLLYQETSLLEGRWKMLDLGCGTGLMGTLLQDYSQELVGVDLSSQMLAAAREKNCYHTLLQQDISDPLKAFQNFDLIIAADVFTYIGKLDGLIASLWELLPAGGYFCFTIETQYHRKDYCLQSSIRYAHHPQYLKHLAKCLGFEIIRDDLIKLRKDQRQTIEGLLFLWKKVL